ncbi:hypothetical protein [Nocardia huaxiensis]|uniref:Uncharacterized protein n=1 Tax=Nocardia huaxiensis TaxID=2755382 RepID=A0A7D6VE28_9NOCA|nr:hypothetical protein [Nocardia huaxiensis]QLY27590.1 hypothetical protein H0264_19110 [Nocardia huaxiensis]UFS99030.1 hypothetical protein LPY97_14590 [Nocardia huaxiensis]
MSTAIVSAAVSTDADTGSYFELAARAGRSALEQAGVTPDRIGLVINAGVYRDSNIAEPAVAALLQKRLEVGLEYRTGVLPAFSFDLLNGGTGVLQALTAAQSFITAGDLEYALILAGDTHPSMQRDREDFPYTATGAALLLRASTETGGFGGLHTLGSTDTAQPTGWADLTAAGTDGRNALTVRTGSGEPLEAAERVVRSALAEAGIGSNDFATGRAVLLAPAPVPGFRERLAYRLGVPSVAVAGVDPAVGDPYSAAPVFAYLSAAAEGLLEQAEAVVFVGADDGSAASLIYRPRPLELSGAAAAVRVKHIGV